MESVVCDLLHCDSLANPLEALHSFLATQLQTLAHDTGALAEAQTGSLYSATIGPSHPSSL